jgi:hypothetical protein
VALPAPWFAGMPVSFLNASVAGERAVITVKQCEHCSLMRALNTVRLHPASSIAISLRQTLHMLQVVLCRCLLCRMPWAAHFQQPLCTPPRPLRNLQMPWQRCSSRYVLCLMSTVLLRKRRTPVTCCIGRIRAIHASDKPAHVAIERACTVIRCLLRCHAAQQRLQQKNACGRCTGPAANLDCHVPCCSTCLDRQLTMQLTNHMRACHYRAAVLAGVT